MPSREALITRTVGRGAPVVGAARTPVCALERDDAR
jgi:hypothetical protein